MLTQRVHLRYWIPLVIFGTILFFVNVTELEYFSISKVERESDNPEDNPLNDFIINTPGCKIPYMDPFDSSVVMYIENLSKPICNHGNPPLFASNLTSIFLLPSSLSKYNVTNTHNLKCCYQPFWRSEPNSTENDNIIKYGSTCYTFTESVNITEEFITVNCTHESRKIYNDTFSFIPLKNKTKIERDSDRLNVLVVGLDAVSRVNLHRQMPKTVEYLKQQDAVELLGYNKVGDNTFPNLMPVLTGSFEEELRNSCWPNMSSRFDNCTFVWNLYKRNDFLTAYGEDASWMGLFNYGRRGFKKQTTDYAYNYFNRLSESRIGNTPVGNAAHCVGGRFVYKELLEYITRFAETMNTNNLPYFSFFWGASLSHDFLNLPKVGDQDYFSFFKKLLEENHLNNTVLIFMSDHGIRWGDIRTTFQGRMEERLPFVFLLLPKYFKTKYSRAYRNLKINTKKLTTPFDLHETLVDLATPSELLIEENVMKLNRSARGVSFFRTISKERTCQDAAISSHWCTCTLSVEVEVDDKVLEAAKFAVESINKQLVGYAQCAKLTLDSVMNARLMRSQITDSQNVDYTITLTTLPNKAIYEVSVRSFIKHKRFEVIGSISRLNLYGSQSSCITDFHLKLYCYCISLLSS